MKGDASATKDASPTPTNMRQISRLQKPASQTSTFRHPIALIRPQLVVRPPAHALPLHACITAPQHYNNPACSAGALLQSAPVARPHPAVAIVQTARPSAISRNAFTCLLASAKTGEEASRPTCVKCPLVFSCASWDSI